MAGSMWMNRFLALGTALLFGAGCASRSEFIPEGSGTTVGMPGTLSERERLHIGEVDAALRSGGYLPVKHGSGEFQLKFRISDGPIHARTKIQLRDGWSVLAEGRGAVAGWPMFGRDRVVEQSFQQAFGEFQSGLPPAGAVGLSTGDDLYEY